MFKSNLMFFRYSSGDDIIPYSITTVDQNIQLSGVPGFSIGGTYTLNTPYITGRNYGIQFSVADCEYLHNLTTIRKIFANCINNIIVKTSQRR